MEKSERSDPTFVVFVVLAAIFLAVLMYVTFPRHEGAVTASSTQTQPSAKK